MTTSSMKSGFLITPTTQSNKKDDPDLGPLQDSRSNRVKFLWGKSSLSTSGPCQPRNEWGNINSGWNANVTSVNNSDLRSFRRDASAMAEQDRNNRMQVNNTLPKSPSNNNNNYNSGNNNNPYSHLPNLPHKTMGVPKNALSAYYGKYHKGIQLSNTQFETWNDGGLSHVRKWTSIFTCPVTKERFPSGRYGDPGNSDLGDGGIVWYKKKALAEHASAARALDCYLWRDMGCGGDSSLWRLCVEEPYEAKMVVDKKEEIMEDVKMSEEYAKKKSEEEIEEEMVRDSYKESRLVSVEDKADCVVKGGEKCIPFVWKG